VQTVVYLTKWVTFRLVKLDDCGLVTGELFRLCAVTTLKWRSGACRRHHFSDRAVLLSGVSPGTSGACGLLRFGTMEALAVYRLSVALGVFQSWTGPARLLWEPAGSSVLMGFGDGRLSTGSAGYR
jgi:hypothetical protein